MPNWCANKLKLSHNNTDMITRFIDAFNREETCNEFVPMPPEYKDTDQWYDWRIANWGTKWDFGLDDGELERTKNCSVECSFLTAWSPPIELYQTLYNIGFRVDATFSESGIGYCGRWKDGEQEVYKMEDTEEVE